MIFKSEVHPDIPYVLFDCKCSFCQRFGGPDNQPLKEIEFKPSEENHESVKHFN